MIDKVFVEEQAKYAQPLMVEREPLANFYLADDYHQDYLDKHPDGYCHLPEALFDFARKAKNRGVRSLRLRILNHLMVPFMSLPHNREIER